MENSTCTIAITSITSIAESVNKNENSVPIDNKINSKINNEWIKVGDMIMYEIVNGIPVYLDWNLFLAVKTHNHVLEEAIVRRIINHPPDSSILENLELFNKWADANTCKRINSEEMKNVIISYLNYRYDHCGGSDDCDVGVVCRTLWNETQFTDTAPRDEIITRLQNADKMMPILKDINR